MCIAYSSVVVPLYLYRWRLIFGSRFLSSYTSKSFKTLNVYGLFICFYSHVASSSAISTYCMASTLLLMLDFGCQ